MNALSYLMLLVSQPQEELVVRVTPEIQEIITQAYKRGYIAGEQTAIDDVEDSCMTDKSFIVQYSQGRSIKYHCKPSLGIEL